MQPQPPTLAQRLARLRRRGVTFSMRDGEVCIDEGWSRLSAEEKAALRAERAEVKARLEARELRRQRREARKRKEQQQAMAAAQQQRERRVIGQVVSPGRPLRLLYADEVTEIDVRRARVLGTVPYGWRK